MQNKLYFIDNKIRFDIESCSLDPQIRCYKIKFKTADTIYTYKENRVSLYTYHNTFVPPYVSVRYKESGVEMSGVNKVSEFISKHYFYEKKCWCINDAKYFTDEKIIVEQSCQTEKSKNAFDYLKSLSQFGLKSEDGHELLTGQYNKIKYIESLGLLDRYLTADSNFNPNISPITTAPIFPFGCNKSQYNAVKNALCNQISIIQGPPGTGKTQTILNIIANLLVADKTIQVVSNNNSAVENVLEKLAKSKYAMDFLVAYLGRSENQANFLTKQTGLYPSIASWAVTDTELHALKKQVESLSTIAHSFYSNQERLAVVENELMQLQIEQKHFNHFLLSIDYTLDTHHIRNASSLQILKKIQTIERDLEKGNRLSLFRKIYLWFLAWCGIDQRDENTIYALKSQYYVIRLQELIAEQRALQEYINTHQHVAQDLENTSLKYLHGILYKRYSKFAPRRVFDASSLKSASNEFLKEYPVVLSTTFSALSNVSSTEKFDYLIMDEASQVDLATGALAFHSARNAVIVGDLKQLPNVVTSDLKQATDTLFLQFDLAEGFRFSENSFLKSLITLFPNIPAVLLREHYRCHPLIIGFCNKKFYGGELIVMTKGSSEDQAIHVLRTVEGNHARGMENIRQVDAIMQEVIPNLSEAHDEVGIIAPYNVQVFALQNSLASNNCENIMAATVHKFQGKEKDVIILSTVDNQIGDFVDDPNLLNVAVSRARKKFYLVVSGDSTSKGNIHDLISYIQYNHGEVVESSVRSVFDLLYSAYTQERINFLQKNTRVSEYDSENIFYNLLCKILRHYELDYIAIACHFPLRMVLPNTSLLTEDECRYACHPWTHIDFLLYDRASLQPLYAIEVDGCSFHKEGEVQYHRDLLKDGILKKYKIHSHRFRTNESNEESIIISDLVKLGIIPQK